MTRISTPMAMKKLREFVPVEKFAIHGSTTNSSPTTNSIAPCNGNGSDLETPRGKRVMRVSMRWTRASA